MTGVLGAYDGPALRRLFEEAGVLAVLTDKGFADFEVGIDSAGRALPHAMLYGYKHGGRFLLLDACVGEGVVRPDYFSRRGHTMPRPMDLAVVHWVREEDPTSSFSAQRPPLPLQRYPGLGIIRRAFRVVVRMAGELNKDAVVNVPKFFHDALIFFRSRLFLFLDGAEQGRFEALVRDLRGLPLGDASLGLVGGCVHDAGGAMVRWEPGYQVFPIAPEMTAYLHSAEYAARVVAALDQSRFAVDDAALARTCALLRATRA